MLISEIASYSYIFIEYSYSDRNITQLNSVSIIMLLLRDFGREKNKKKKNNNNTHLVYYYLPIAVAYQNNLYPRSSLKLQLPKK
jgi:hypothetical protein